MNKRLTRNVIHKKFKKQYPDIHKQTVYWHPHDQATIELYLKDGSKAWYVFDTNDLVYLDERWINERGN